MGKHTTTLKAHERRTAAALGCDHRVNARHREGWPGSTPTIKGAEPMNKVSDEAVVDATTVAVIELLQLDVSQWEALLALWQRRAAGSLSVPSWRCAVEAVLERRSGREFHFTGGMSRD